MKINFVDNIWDNTTYKEEPTRCYNTTAPAGSVQWMMYNNSDREHNLTFTCPCGCGKIGAVIVETDTEKGWKWNGDKINPTFTPSILQIGGCCWHGYLTNGEWIPV